MEKPKKTASKACVCNLSKDGCAGKCHDTLKIVARSPKTEEELAKEKVLHKQIAKKFDSSLQAYQAVMDIVDDANKKMNESQDILSLEIYNDGIDTNSGEVEFVDTSVTFSPNLQKLGEIWDKIKDLPNNK